MKNILAINPWIYDFAAYDYWIKPYGFLQILQVLKEAGFKICFIDTLDRYQENTKKIYTNKKKYGMGRFYTREVPKPKILKSIPRKYKQYGMPDEIFINLIRNQNPDIIMVTSSMTYWYPGVIKAINICKKYFPNTPLFLGGTYATLCHKHAMKVTSTDYIIKYDQLYYFALKIKQITNKKIDLSYKKLKNTFPDYFDYYSKLPYAVLKTSWGCPFNCSYCASKYLSPKKIIFSDTKKTTNYIYDLYKHGIKHFVFYDDALLYNQNHILKILRTIYNKNIKAFFHTPNGLHAKFLNQDIASLMKKTNFINPRVSLETTDKNIPNFINNKVSMTDFKKAILNLKKAGYKNKEYSVYLLLGLPGENLNKIEKSLYMLNKMGLHIYLTEFSPVPKTLIWQNSNIRYKNNPLMQNNTLFPAYKPKNWEKLQQLKDLSKKLNQSLKK